MEGYNDDWTGFDTGSRNLPSSLSPIYANGDFISLASASYAELVTAGQNFGGQWAPQIESLSPNFGFDFSYGNSFDNDYGRFGVVISAGYDNSNSYIPDIKRTNYARGSGEELVGRDTYDVKKTNNQ